MVQLVEILIYPIQRLVTLLFSMSVDGLSVGSLMVAALIMCAILGLFVGGHMLEDISSSIGGRVNKSRKDKEKGGG